MARFERSRKSNRDFKGSSSRRDTRDNRDDKPRSRSSSRDNRGRRDSRDRPQGRDFRGGSSSRDFRDRRDSGSGSNRYSRDRPEMTKVICSSCGVECEVPFKPTTDKPLFCRDCFAKKGKSGSDNRSSRDLEIINEKLDKIMKSLKIE